MSEKFACDILTCNPTISPKIDRLTLPVTEPALRRPKSLVPISHMPTMKQPLNGVNPPLSPLKRTWSGDYSQEKDHEWKRKRRKTDVTRHIRHQQPNAIALAQRPQNRDVVDAYMSRSLSTALLAAGFDGATGAALESFRMHVEEYILSFLSIVSKSMLSCRRTSPIPLDFIQALSKNSLTSSALKPHLKNHIPPQVSIFPVEELEPTTDNLYPADFPSTEALDSISGLLNSKSSNTTNVNLQQRRLPPGLPPFPSDHTWRSSAVYIERELDPITLREKSMKEGLLAEDALRTLMLARQRGLGAVASAAAEHSELAPVTPAKSIPSRLKTPKSTKKRRHLAPQKDPVLSKWEQAMKDMIEFDKHNLESEASRLSIAAGAATPTKGDLAKPNASPLTQEDVPMEGEMKGELSSWQGMGFAGLFGDEFQDLEMRDATPEPVPVAPPSPVTQPKRAPIRPFEYTSEITLDSGMVVNYERKYWRHGGHGAV